MADLDAAVERVRTCLVSQRKVITAAQFKDSEAKWRAVLDVLASSPRLGLSGVSVLLVLNAMHWARLSTEDLMAGEAAWLDMPFKADPKLLVAEGGGKSPADFKPKKLFGETLVALGVCSASDVNRALEIQSEVEKKAKVRMILGQILVAAGKVAAGPFCHVAAIHFGVPFKRADVATLESIRQAFLKRQG